MARQERKFHYIYKTICITTGNFYVGMHSTDNLEDGYIGSGKRLWHSIRKHGLENHRKEILEFLPDRNSLKIREKEIINEKFLEDLMCMNLMVGDEGGNPGNEVLKKAHAGASNSLKRRWQDPIYAAQMKIISRNTFAGKHHTEETKQRLREKTQQRTGDKSSCWGTCWIFHEEHGNKKIKLSELDSFFSQGWERGRTLTI